jgi:hypothetical protein
MIKTVLGINPTLDFPGFKRVDIKPYFFSELDYAEGYSDTVSGKISVSWQRKEGRVTLKIDVPGGIEAYYGGKLLSEGLNEIRI